MLRDLRVEAERQLQHANAEFREEQGRLAQHARNLDRHQEEMDTISRTLKQVDMYNEELRSKILVAKRSTLKAERDITKQELEKRRQVK